MKLIKIITFFLILVTIPLNVNPSNNLVNILNEGGKLIFIRHAYAPGGGDPDNFDILNCESQRNLNKEGIEQAKRIGKFFSKKNLKIEKVLSSEWCRCKDTAMYAFERYSTKFFLNSFYDEKYKSNKKQQLEDLYKFIKNWNGKNNLIFVTHYVVIQEVFDVALSSGEMIVSDKKFNIVGRLKFSQN